METILVTERRPAGATIWSLRPTSATEMKLAETEGRTGVVIPEVTKRKTSMRMRMMKMKKMMMTKNFETATTTATAAAATMVTEAGRTAETETNLPQA